MFGAILRRSVTGGALLLAAFLAADAAGIRDDLPDLNNRIARMAANEPALKRALLESGAAFEEFGESCKRLESGTLGSNGTRLTRNPPWQGRCIGLAG